MHTLTVEANPIVRPLRILLVTWAALALALAASGALRGAPPPIVPALIGGLVLAALAAHRRQPALRALVARMDPRPAIGFHVVRIGFGLAFLRLAAGGELPEAFARVAGPGDVAAGALALVAVWAAGDLSSRPRRAVVFAWNLLALADILAVVVTAQRLMLFVGDPRMLGMLSRFPFATLPLFVVPMVILTHLAIFARLRAA